MADKEVYFGLYCDRCIYRGAKETDDICSVCLENPVNTDSHKPVQYKEGENLRKKAMDDGVVKTGEAMPRMPICRNL